MNSKDFFDLLVNTEIDANKVEIIQKIYGKPINDELKKIVSLMADSIFLENDVRLLSFSEIKNADEEYDTEFVKMLLVPFFDSFENDFIVYDLTNNNWCKYNIIDKTMFSKKRTLAEILT